MYLATKMAVESNIINNYDVNIIDNIALTANDIKKIAHLERCPAKELLEEKLGVPPFHNCDDQRKALFVSYIYKNIMFAVEKGFPWEHVCIVVKFAHEYLQRILVENHQLSDAVQDFTKTAHIIAPLCDRHQKQYTDFVFNTVLCHYNLYKYVFLHQRDLIKSDIVETVEIPPQPLPLAEGENLVIWEYNNKLRDIDMKAAQAHHEQQELKRRLSLQTANHRTLESLSNVPLPYNEMILKDLVTDVLAGYTEKKELELKFKVDEVATELNFKLQKVIIRRPAEIGAPSRKKSQSPPFSGKSGSYASLKVKERAQSGSSLKPSTRKSIGSKKM